MNRRTLLAAAAYCFAACLFTWPLVLHWRTRLGALDATGDASLNLWALGWDLRVISEHPSWLFTGRVFDANIFFPAPRTLAYSDHLLPQAVVLWPVYAITGDLVLCYNLLFFGSLVAAALAMHVLARELTGRERAAYISGLIFGFAPYHFAHLEHVQLQALYFMPLSFLWLYRLFERERRIDTVMLGVVLGLQTISSMYCGIIGGIGIGFATVALLVLTRRVRAWRLLRRAATAAVVAVLVALPWIVPYLLVHRQTGAGRTIGDAATGATLASYLQAPATNLLYGRTGVLRPGPGAWLQYSEGLEQELFPGFCALLLALLGCVFVRKESWKATVVFAVVAVVGVVLSMGSEGPTPLYSWLYRGLFGMAAMRAAPRFGVLALVGIAVLAALAIRSLEVRQPRLAGGIVVAALLAIAVEYSNGAIAYAAPPSLRTGAGAWLRDQPGSGAVLCVPMRVWLANTPCMLQSLEHRRPVVNGYSGFMPLFFEAMVETANRLPGADALLALHNIGVQYVVSDTALPVEPAFSEVLVERIRFDQQLVYELRWSPEIESTVRAHASGDVPPPDPGPIPFVVGEAATYRLRWTSGPLELAAGQASISVATHAAAAYAFRVDASTAPWMSRFYKAIVRLESATNESLLPLTYSEMIDESTREIERQLTFDPERHEVRIVSGGTSIVLPVGIGSRDPISALFYLRTLPLVEGARYGIPISDNGRPLRLDVAVGPRESIVLDGSTWTAWKVQPSVSERIDRDPLRMTLWLSADERRVPLVVDVSAQFGTARVELTEYRRE